MKRYQFIRKVLLSISLITVFIIAIFLTPNKVSACGSVTVGSCDGGICIQEQVDCTCDYGPDPSCIAALVSCTAGWGSCMKQCNELGETGCDTFCDCGTASDCPEVEVGWHCPSRGCSSNCGCGCPPPPPGEPTTTEPPPPPPPPETQTCRWHTCDNILNTCSVNRSRTISIEDVCPEGCVNDAECSGVSGKCGLDSSRNLICKLDGTGTGASCRMNSDCVSSGMAVTLIADKYTAKPNEIINFTATPESGTPPYTYQWFADGSLIGGVVSNILNRGFNLGEHTVSVTARDNRNLEASDAVALAISDSGPVCIINSASVTPAYPKVIYLGGKFEITWQSNNDCSACTITCNNLEKCGVNGLTQPVGNSGEIDVKPSAAGYYAYKITCDGGTGGTSSMVLPSTDVWDGVTQGPLNAGYRVRRPFIFETPAFLKLLIDKLFQ